MMRVRTNLMVYFETQSLSYFMRVTGLDNGQG